METSVMALTGMVKDYGMIMMMIYGDVTSD
jgi:hypothetical protein